MKKVEKHGLMALGFWTAVVFTLFFHFSTLAQHTGDVPYVAQFGVNQQSLGSNARWQVTNKDTNDIGFVGVNYYTNETVFHIWIEAGDTYTFNDIPKGIYTYKFSSAGSYFKGKTNFTFKGCDSTPDEDGMYYKCDKASFPYEWMVDVWVERSKVTGPTGKITKDEFFKQ